MKRKMHVSRNLFLGAFLLLILFSSPPCNAGEISGIRVMMSPVPGIPMEISFNGSSRAIPASTSPGVLGQHLLPGSFAGPEERLRTDKRPFARIQAYMLKYVNIGTPLSTEELFDSTASSHIEGRPSEKISLEVQAGLTDLSGALFIVLQI